MIILLTYCISPTSVRSRRTLLTYTHGALSACPLCACLSTRAQRPTRDSICKASTPASTLWCDSCDQNNKSVATWGLRLGDWKNTGEEGRDIHTVGWHFLPVCTCPHQNVLKRFVSTLDLWGTRVRKPIRVKLVIHSASGWEKICVPSKWRTRGHSSASRSLWPLFPFLWTACQRATLQTVKVGAETE